MSKLTSFQLFNLVKAGVPKAKRNSVFATLKTLGLLTLTPRNTYIIPDELTVTRADIPIIIGKVIECTR
ncbi:MAG: hypothetical protein KME46_34130 [Brasilonema angustatum HA4187-MV1]|jgi:ethanolamine utilization microcompartment shell protein EutS|nr:hypothetical protein [Brasilonema angustatum HA4187-MV1]